MIRHARTMAAGRLLLLVVAACGRDHPDSADGLTRSASASPTFPTDPSTLAAALGVPVDSLAAAAQERYAREEFDSVRAILQVEVARAHRAGDIAAEGRGRMWLGLASWRLTDYPAARREGEAALALKRRAGLDAELSQSFNALGLVAWNQGRHHDALTLFDSSTAAARRHGDAKGVARAAGNIGLVEVELGDFDAARGGFAAMLAAAQPLGDERYWGNALANLGMLEIRLGNPSAALPLLAEARRHYSRIDYATGELINALGQIATAWTGLGELQRAIAAADSGLALARALGAQLEVAAALEILADLHVQAGNLRLALARLAEADSLDAQLGLAVERGTDLRRSSAILLELGEAGAATSRGAEALEVHRAVEARPEMVRDRLQLALAAAGAGDRPRAEAETDTALVEAARIANPAVARDAAMVAAQLALDADHPQEALRHLAVAASSGADWRVADLRAEALLATGKLRAARSEAERSIAALERERASLGVGPLRSAYLASRAGPYSRLVTIDLALTDTSAAFATAASLPGRSLAERLGGLGDSGGSVAAVAEGERLLLRAAALEQTLDTLSEREGVDAQRGSLEAALGAARAAYEEQLASRAIEPSDGMLGLSPTNLAVTQSRLAGDEALVTFLSGPDRLDVFLVRPGRVLHSSVPLGERALAMRVRLARELLSGAARGQPVPAALGELHDMLFGELIAAGGFDGVSHLLLVPHGPLGALPFAALWDRRSGRFLVEDQVLTYLPTVAALGGSRSRADTPMGELMVFAPLPDSLPGTAREARSINLLVPGSQVRSGRASGEAGIRQALETGQSVHLASHGARNAQNPLFTRVIVGRDRGTGSADDGRLEVHEILGLRTTSSLVFLSGCETGLGAAGQDPFTQGDDEGSLAQAFLVAGAGAVVATLWRVGDAAAADLAERFYGGLEVGESAAAALARSQREAIRSRRGVDWAAYGVWGTGGRNSAGLVRVTGTEP
jgi:CHAT domain-containing protein